MIRTLKLCKSNKLWTERNRVLASQNGILNDGTNVRKPDLIYEKIEKWERDPISELWINFLQLCQRSNELKCINPFHNLELNFSALKQFVLEFKTIEAMRQKRENKSVQKLFAFKFEPKSLKRKKIVLCPFCFNNATEELKEQIGETYDETASQSSSKGQSITHTMKADVGTKSCSADEKYSRYSKFLSASRKTK